jgi:putative transposase
LRRRCSPRPRPTLISPSPSTASSSRSREWRARLERHDEPRLRALGAAAQKKTLLARERDEAQSGRWREEVGRLDPRRLVFVYPYVFVDARYEKVRVNGRVVSQGVLIVSAVRDDGCREIVAVEVADTESEATYQDLFRSLKSRGLSGVELVVSDDHEGLKAAIARHFQGTSHQRCQVHYARNLLGMVRTKRRKELAEGLRGVFAAPSREVALRLASELAARWRRSHPAVAKHLEEHIEECLSCLAFPESHRRRIRTTNGLERLNQEIKRRSRVVRIFPNREACLRLVSALAIEQSEEWVTSRRYLDMDELKEHGRGEERREREEAVC